ncbi:MAG: peptidylprolyl isomerase [Bacteroidales bacterium]|nr:peptidylprolyl isomerase [Bacteroidales bacterium]
MKKTFIILFTMMSLVLFFSYPSVYAQQLVLMETTLGNIKIKLYNETPVHKSNFLKLVSSGFYNNVLFHRVIEDFMIQAGDPESKSAISGQQLGSGGPGYTIPAEFNRTLFHKKGAVAAARQGDNINPEQASSGSQFYIVQGQLYTEEQLYSLTAAGNHAPFTSAQIRAYTTLGGTPHLDNAYTVFGEVVDGLDVVDKIASVQTDSNNRPVVDVKIIKVSIIE